MALHHIAEEQYNTSMRTCYNLDSEPYRMASIDRHYHYGVGKKEIEPSPNPTLQLQITLKKIFETLGWAIAPFLIGGLAAYIIVR